MGWSGQRFHSPLTVDATSLAGWETGAQRAGHHAGTPHSSRAAAPLPDSRSAMGVAARVCPGEPSPSPVLPPSGPGALAWPESPPSSCTPRAGSGPGPRLCCISAGSRTPGVCPGPCPPGGHGLEPTSPALSVPRLPGSERLESPRESRLAWGGAQLAALAGSTREEGLAGAWLLARWTPREFSRHTRQRDLLSVHPGARQSWPWRRAGGRPSLPQTPPPGGQLLRKKGCPH